MIRSFKSITTAAMLLVTTLVFTSCEGAFDDIFGEWSRPGSSEKVLGAALKEGAIISYTIIENDAEKIITFQKEGDKYVLISPASTRMHDGKENKRYTLDWDSDDDGSGNSGDTNNGGSGGGGTFVFNVIAADGTPALTVVTRVVDASTQVATYNDNYDLKGMTLNGQQLEQFNQALEKSKNGPKAKLTCEKNPVLSITLSIPELGVTTWKDINYDGIKLESDAKNTLVLTYKCKINDADAEPEDVKFGVSYNNGVSIVPSAITDLVGKPTRDYILERQVNRN